MLDGPLTSRSLTSVSHKPRAECGNVWGNSQRLRPQQQQHHPLQDLTLLAWDSSFEFRAPGVVGEDGKDEDAVGTLGLPGSVPHCMVNLAGS